MTDRPETNAPEASAEHGPDCPLYGQFHGPDAATRSSIRGGCLLALLGGVLAFVGATAGKIYWFGQIKQRTQAAGRDLEQLAAVMQDLNAAWLPYVVLPMVLGAIPGVIGVWLLTVPGGAPDRGGVSARKLSRFFLLAIPYAIVATYLYRDAEIPSARSFGEYVYVSGVVLALALLVLSIARHLDNILAHEGAALRLVPQLFYWVTLVAAAVGLQQNMSAMRQDPDAIGFNRWFALAIGVSVLLGAISLLQVRSELTGVRPLDLDDE